jgi:hypothetical protein
MSDNLIPFPQHPSFESERESGAVPISAIPSVGTATEHGIATAPVVPPETQALLELIGRGLTPEADDATRGVARDLWARFAATLAATAQVAPGAPIPVAPAAPTAPVMPSAPVMPGTPVATSPITMAARALRQMSPDQLLEVALDRLRSKMPTGAEVPTPKGIQFQLVPVTPPASK